MLARATLNVSRSWWSDTPLQRKRALKGAKDEQHLRILRESNPLSQAERACSQ